MTPEQAAKEYREDKYSGTEILTTAKLCVMFVALLSILAILSSGATAFEFRTVSYKESVLDFEWCFVSPYGEDKGWMSDDVELYNIDMGCDVTDTELIKREYTPVTTSECKQVTDKCTVPEDIERFDNPSNCTTKTICQDVTEYHLEERDLSVDDNLIGVDDVLCLRAKRPASTESCSVDVNFRTSEYDVASYGFAWWNITFQRKYGFNISSVSTPPYRPMLVTLNDSVMNMSDCQADGGDVRILDSTESTELVYNMSSWDGTTGEVYVNLSLSTDQFIYLYCNASSPVSTTSEAIRELELLNNLYYALQLDEGTGNAIDSSGNIVMYEQGTVPNVSGYHAGTSGRGDYSTANYFYRNTTASEMQSPNFTGYTVSAWVQYDGTALSWFNNFDGFRRDDGAGAVKLYRNHGGSFRFFVGGSLGNGDAWKNQVLSTDAWYHLVGKEDAASMTSHIWVNGSIGTNDSFSGSSFIPDKHTVGAYRYGSTIDQSSVGFPIDEIVAWNYSMSDDDIVDLLWGDRDNTRYPFYSTAVITLSTAGVFNTAPTIGGEQILPSPSYTNSTLNCSLNVTDAEQSSLNITIEWSTGASESFINIANGSTVNSTISSGYTAGNNVTCDINVGDGYTNSTASAWILISNTAPIGMVISSPTNSSIVYTNTSTVEWTCNDIDFNDTLTGYFYVNGTLNATATANESVNLTGLELDVDYLLEGVCGDATSNISADDVLFSTSSLIFCNASITTPCAGCRYQDNILTVEYSCINACDVTDCWHTTNKYAAIYPSNCSSGMFNITAELGRNRFTFTTNTSNGAVSSTEVNFWAKKQEASSFAEYIVIIITAACAFLFFTFGRLTGLRVIDLMTGIALVVLGFEVWAFAAYVGYMFIGLGMIMMAWVFAD